MLSSSLVLSKTVNATSFMCCIIYQGPRQVTTYYNIGNGHFHQYIYIIDGDGSAVGEVRDTDDLSTKPVIVRTDDAAGTLIDIDETTRGKYITTTTHDTGISMLMFNPVPDTRKLKVEIVKGDAKGSTKRTITATTTRITIVSILGPVLANGIEINSLDYANILPGKSAELEVPANAVCALVSE